MSTQQEDERGWPPEFAALVGKIRAEGGDFTFRYREDEKQLYAVVDLPVPGAVGLVTFAGAPIAEEHSADELMKQAQAAYYSCKSKLLTLNPPPTPVEIPDNDLLKEMGISWIS